MAFIEMKNVSFTYPGAKAPALSSIDFAVERGEFVVLLGASGSGKSTLLRLLKKQIRPHGTLSGELHVPDSGSAIGFVFQDPDNQIVSDDPLNEMAFGLENLGLSQTAMRSRVAEMANYFGAEPILRKKMHELSGGKKQQMNLASVLLMQPDILLLDEPASQLDPVSSRELFDMLARLNEEFGMTIIMAEHRLDEAITLCDRMVMLEHGRIASDGPPRQLIRDIWEGDAKPFVPEIPALFMEAGGRGVEGGPPLSVKEGRRQLADSGLKMPEKADHERESGPLVLSAKSLSFHYEKKQGPILDSLHFCLRSREVYALLGGNGSGKSTLLKLLCGAIEPDSGKIELEGRALKKWKEIDAARRIAYLPQNPKLYFLHETIGEEIEETAAHWGTGVEEAKQLIEEFGLGGLTGSHPYDLSGGELQKAALVCMLLRNPSVFLLDEPTKGLDPVSKQALGLMLKKLQERGAAVLLATHDIEFAAKYASRCGMLFQGEITSEDVPDRFFEGNFFYSTMLSRLFRSQPLVGNPGMKGQVLINGS